MPRSFTIAERELLDATQASPKATNGLIADQLFVSVAAVKQRWTRLKGRFNVVGDPDARAKIIALYNTWRIQESPLTGARPEFRTLDEYLDVRSLESWPSARDVAEGRVFLSTAHLEDVARRLDDCGRCLLLGRPASGRTALAIIYGLRWRDEGGSRRVFYLDVDPGSNDTSAVRWADRISASQKEELYIIDNCHRAPAAAHLLCRLTASAAAAVIFISAARSSEFGWDDEPDEYVAYLEAIDAAITVRAEDLYLGVLRTYSDAYVARAPGRFVPVDDDLRSPEAAERLRVLCAHNLIVARGLLEAWNDLEGRLSDVPPEAALPRLARRVLSAEGSSTVAALCALAQFDVTPHQGFVERLPISPRAAMRREGLLAPVETSAYGRCYRVAWHSQVSALVWQAWLQWQGIASEEAARREILAVLRDYVAARPANLMELIRQLHARGQGALQGALITDPGVSATVDDQLPERPVREALWYLYVVQVHDRTLGRAQAASYFSRVPAARIDDALRGAGREFPILAFFLLAVRPSIAAALLGNLDAPWVAARLSEAHPRFIERWIGDAEGACPDRLGYGSEWRRDVAEEIDLDALIDRLRHVSAATFYVCVKGFVEAAPPVARELLRLVRPELPRWLPRLGPQPGAALFRWARRIECESSVTDEIASRLSVDAIVGWAGEARLQAVFWLLRDLRKTAPERHREVLVSLAPAGFAARLREDRATAQDLGSLETIWPAAFGREVLTLLGDSAIADLLDRSPLPEIGALVEYKAPRYDEHYERFAARALRRRLEEEPLRNITRFLAHLRRRTDARHGYAAEAIDALLTVNLSARAAQTDAEQLTLLLTKVREVDLAQAEREQGVDEAAGAASARAERLFGLLSRDGAMESSIGRSGLRGIQLLLRVGGGLLQEKAPGVARVLEERDLSEVIMATRAPDVAHFLWNAYEFVGEACARACCADVDRVCDDEWIAVNDLAAVADVVWNVIHLGGNPAPSVLTRRALWRKVGAGWLSQPGECLRIIGMAAATRALAVAPEGLDLDRVQNPLSNWIGKMVESRRPYILAQAIRGIAAIERASSSGPSDAFNRMNLTGCISLLEEALDRAETEPSRELLRHSLELLTTGS